MKRDMVQLDDVAEFIRNGASIKQYPNADGLKITRIETISQREVNLNKCGYANIQENEYSNYRLQKYDILISHINSEIHLGKCAIFKEERNDVVHGMNLLVLRTNKKIFPMYLFHVLSSTFFLKQIPKITKKSVNQASFTVTSFKGLLIPLPPLDEQKRIADILDKVDGVRRKRKENIKLADAFIKSVFLDMFGDPVTNPKGWEVKPLGESLVKIRYGTSTPPRFSESGNAFIRATNIKHGYIVSENMKYISHEEGNKIQKCRVRTGELIIVRSGVNSGDTCVITSEYSNHYAGYDIIITLKENVINPIFINTLLNTNYMNTIIKPLTARAAQPHLNSEQVQSLPIILPLLPLQKQFAEIVQRVEKSKIRLQSQLAETETLFKALQQDFFE